MAALATVGLLFCVAVADPASAAAAGSSGSFVFGGYISGTLKAPAYLPSSNHTDCSVTANNVRSDIPDTDVFNWNVVELKVGRTSKRISFIDLQIQVSKLGRTVVMTPEDGSSDSLFFSTGAPYNWRSESGTITPPRAEGPARSRACCRPVRTSARWSSSRAIGQAARFCTAEFRGIRSYGWPGAAITCARTRPLLH